MNIGIIRISTKADRYRLKQTIESTGVQVVQTIDSASMPPTIVFVGTEDQMLMAFKQAESLGVEYAKVLTHIREVSPKLIKALKEGPKFKPGQPFGILETAGPEAILACANLAAMFDGIELAEIQLASMPNEKSLVVITGDKKLIESVLESAEMICEKTHFTVPGSKPGQSDGRQN